LIFSKDIIKEIKERVDIVSIIGEYVYSLKKSGKNWIGLCPFHNDKTPSFSVSQDYGIYKCFACGESGDVIKFVEKIEGLEFTEAVEFLARKANISVEYQSTGEQKTIRKKDDLIRFNDRIVKLFQHFLLEREEGQDALDYLKKRGIDHEIINTFKIGYAPKGYNRLLSIIQKKGFKDDFLVESGIFSRGDRDLKTLFFDRVMFPIFNYRNECVGFGGRALNNDIKPKYINSPETILYKKSYNLYGMNWAKEHIQKEKKVFIVEGYVDVITCFKNGIKNVVAPCGTALTKEQIKLLGRYCGEIVVLLDGDEAGLKGAVKALKEFANIENVKTSVLVIPDGMDPDDYFKKYTIDDFKNFEKESIAGFDFLVFYHSRYLDKTDYQSLSGTLENLFDYINIWESEIIRNSFIEKLSNLIDIEKGVLLKEFNSFINKSKNFVKKEEIKVNLKENKEESILDKIKKREIDLLLLLTIISDGKELIKRSSLKKEHFFYPDTQNIYCNFFENNLINKQNVIDYIDDDKIKNYINERLFSIEFRLDENVLRNSAVDRIKDVIKKYYVRLNEEITEKIRLCELYKDDETVKELQEEKTINISEILKLSKLQELKK